MKLRRHAGLIATAALISLAMSLTALILRSRKGDTVIPLSLTLGQNLLDLKRSNPSAAINLKGLSEVSEITLKGDYDVSLQIGGIDILVPQAYLIHLGQLGGIVTDVSLVCPDHKVSLGDAYNIGQRTVQTLQNAGAVEQQRRRTLAELEQALSGTLDRMPFEQSFVQATLGSASVSVSIKRIDDAVTDLHAPVFVSEVYLSDQALTATQNRVLQGEHQKAGGKPSGPFPLEYWLQRMQ